MNIYGIDWKFVPARSPVCQACSAPSAVMKKRKYMWRGRQIVNAEADFTAGWTYFCGRHAWNNGYTK